MLVCVMHISNELADIERIKLPVRHARHDILIKELSRVEHASEVSTLKVLLEGIRPTEALSFRLVANGTKLSSEEPLDPRLQG